MPLTLGSHLGPYTIVAPLGRGGMGEVYRAKDRRLDREVAIKVLPEHLSADPNSLRRFEREAKAVAALSHPNIVTIHDVGSEQGIPFAVMELLQGQTLRSTLAGEPLPWRRAVEIGVAVAEGLAAAHSKGVIHRDLKPENIFITSDGAVKILDFGLAHFKPQVLEQELTEAPTESNLTESGTMMGTVPYMSPEQVRGESVDVRTDIFSLGSVLYEMLTGKRAFQRGTSAETLSAILRDEPAELPENIPPELSHIIRHCLAKNPEQRFQAPRDLVFALREVGAHHTSPAMARKSLRLVTAITSVVIATVAIVALMIGLRKDSAQETTVPNIQSLAVLPLKNVSGDPKQEYFSDGMTEELIAKLAKIKSLRVISRTSVMEYKQTTKKIPDIGKELNVDGIMEGSVMQAGGRVRITAQLIHVKSDRHLWAESYERDLREILALQSEIASTIAQEIKAQLTPQEKAHFADAAGVNPEAYHAYLRGLDYYDRWDFSMEYPRLAVEMFQRAVELDPNFTTAYAKLSIAHSSVYHNGVDRSTSRLSQAKWAADHAVKLGTSEGHTALGYYYYWGYKDYDRALQEFATAQKDLPNNLDVLEGIGAIYRRQGNFEATLDCWKRVLEANPRDAKIAEDIGLTYWLQRKYAEAGEYFDREISIAPDEGAGYVHKAWNQIRWKGSTEAARSTCDKAPKKTGDTGIMWCSFLLNLLEKNHEGALVEISSSPVEAFSDSNYFIPKAQWVGEIRGRMNQPDLAHQAFEEARIVAEAALKKNPEDARVLSALGLAHAGLGHKEEAIRYGKLAVTLLPVSKDAFGGWFQIDALARIYLMIGEYDASMDQIESLLSIPSWITVPQIRIDPTYDPLRNHPRFQLILQKP